MGEIMSGTLQDDEPIQRASYSYHHKETLPKSNSKIYDAAPYVRVEFDMSSNPYLHLQMADLHKTEAQRREEASGRGSGMVEQDKAAPAFRPSAPLSNDVDRADFNQRWMAELREAVLSSAQSIQSQESRGRDRAPVNPELSR